MDISFSRESAVLACKDMQDFYSKLNGLYQSSGMSLESNRGRRNILMSGPMELFLANSINQVEILKNNLYHSVVSDGKTGEPDIIIYKNETGERIEIECKLTSPTQSSGSITFQTDHDTLVNKGSLDYVYIVAGEAFDRFCVLYFKGLTIEDFRPLSPGARGKVQMYKYLGMKKCTMLIGSAIDSKKVKLEKFLQKDDEKYTCKKEQLVAWQKKLSSLNKTQTYERTKLLGQIENAGKHLETMLNNRQQSVTMINNEKSRYSFEFETL